MSSCKEFILDDVMAITAIPLDDFPVGTAPWQMAPTISNEDLYPSLDNAITIGLQPAVAGGILVPIRRSTGKVKDNETDGVAGRLHSVAVSCEVDDRDGNILNDLFALERMPAHLVLTFRDNTRAFVSATEDTYICNVERDGSKTTVTFQIQNLMGIQIIV